MPGAGWCASARLERELDIDLWLLTDADLRHFARVSAFMDFVGAELAKHAPALRGRSETSFRTFGAPRSIRWVRLRKVTSSSAAVG